MEPFKIIKVDPIEHRTYIKICKEYEEDYLITLTSSSFGETLIVCISRKDNNQCKFCKFLSISEATAQAIDSELIKYKFDNVDWFLKKNHITSYIEWLLKRHNRGVGENKDFCSESCKEEYNEVYR